MNFKYRIRLQNQRVIGPFSEDEIGELFSKDHIVGTEMCQHFPIGDWKPLTSFSNLNEIIEKIKLQASLKPEITSPVKEEVATPVTTLKKDKEESGIKSFKEFKFEKENRQDINYEELEKKYQAENPDVPVVDRMEKTVVARIKPPKVDELDKTVVIKRPAPKHPPVVEPVKPEKVAIVELKEEAPVQSYKDQVNEKTEFINLAMALPTINAQLSISEVELEKQAKIEENLEKIRLKELQEIMLREQAIEDGEEESEVEVVEEYSKEKKVYEQRIVVKKKKKGMSIIAVLAFVGVFYFFLDSDKKPVSTGPSYLEIKFPITADVEDVPKSNAAIKEARNLYSQGTYKNRAMASAFYLVSLQQRFSGNEAMGETILNYAELIDNAKDRYQATGTIYKFIQLAESRMLNDANAATGAALFYGKIGKYQTGIYIVKNYLRAGNRPTPKMLTYYLSLLMNAGEFVEARSAYEALLKIPSKPFESYFELAQFNIANDNPTEAKVLLEEGIKYYPSSVLLLLQYSELLLKEQAIKKFEEILVKINKLRAEDSPYFLSIYFKQLGYLAAYKKDIKKASQLFKSSLELKESDELRSTLSKLEIGGDQVSQTLILESKVLGLLKRAKVEYRNRNIDLAFQYAIEAVDANPDYIPAVLFQAELNTDRGFFESALYSLQRSIDMHQKNYALKNALIETYIKSYKLEDAERVLSELALTKYAMGPEYASLMGKYSDARKNSLNAVRWFDRAISRNPLSDSDMYLGAKVLVRNKRFTEARGRLSKALLLDPKNVNYHALYSEILYEQDGADTGIGYLRDTISELGEDPILISAIATAYFKSGQINEFQRSYKKVQSLPKKDEGFYEFLINAAKLEGRKSDFIEHSNDLLKLNPGNLKVRMDLGELLYQEKRYDEAILEFNEVKDKLASYPRVHYHLARVYLAKNNFVLAREMAQKELELNPNLDLAHFIMGEIHRAKKEYREAVIKYEKAISLNPRLTDALVAMAALRLAQNYSNEAIELLLRAVKENVTNPTIHKLLGDAYRASGQRALAKEKYEDYLKINPGAQDKDLIDSLIKNLQ